MQWQTLDVIIIIIIIIIIIMQRNIYCSEVSQVFPACPCGTGRRPGKAWALQTSR
jgi:hypothetical protein